MQASQVPSHEVIDTLCREFPEADPQWWHQTLTRWRVVLGIKQPERGWYDKEDLIGLIALGTAYRRHKLQGQRAKDYALSVVHNWKRTHGY